jgi:concentrative nucleoside transporter, CNT family
MQSLQSALGVVTIVAIAFIISENHRAVPWRPVIVGLVVTFALALLMLKVPQTEIVFGWVNRAVEAIAAATRAGTSFVFGYVGGGALPFDPKSPGSDFILAFQALPVVLVMSVLSSLLFYWRILPPIVRGFSRALERTLDVGGAAGLSTAANIFVGQVEAPLFIRPYLDKLSRSEMFIVMTGGMAGIAGTVFVLYATILVHAIPNAAGHIVVCSVLGAPAAIVISPLMVPDPNRRHTGGRLDDVKQTAGGTMDAIVQGTGSGLELLLNIVAMLIVFVALVYLANAALGLLPDFLGSPVTLQRTLGWIIAPVCWLMGIPWSQAVTAGGLMGIKTILNELLAYLQLAALPDGALDPRSRLIMLYAMCGFANFGSLGIMIAGLATMCPPKRDEVACRSA